MSWEYISITNCKVKVLVNIDADRTMISSKIRNELDKFQLDSKIRQLKAYNGHQLSLLGSLNCDAEWNGSMYTQEIIIWQSQNWNKNDYMEQIL